MAGLLGNWWSMACWAIDGAWLAGPLMRAFGLAFCQVMKDWECLALCQVMKTGLLGTLPSDERIGSAWHFAKWWKQELVLGCDIVVRPCLIILVLGCFAWIPCANIDLNSNHAHPKQNNPFVLFLDLMFGCNLPYPQEKISHSQPSPHTPTHHPHSHPSLPKKKQIWILYPKIWSLYKILWILYKIRRIWQNSENFVQNSDFWVQNSDLFFLGRDGPFVCGGGEVSVKLPVSIANHHVPRPDGEAATICIDVP